MRLTRSGPDSRAATPEASVWGSPPARSNDQHQHMDVVRDAVTPDVAAQHQTQIVDGQPPPSNVMTSQLDAAHAIDFGTKFIGGLDALPKTVTRPQPTAAASEPPQLHGKQLQCHDPAAAEQPEAPVGSPDYPEKSRKRPEAGRQDDEAECHPFWLSWRDIFLGIWLIAIGILKIPLVIGDGMGKALHHTPELYGDKTVRKWPQLTGFPHGCIAGFSGLWYGLYDGLTDWVTLPYKSVRDGGGVQGCLKGLLQGIANVFFKLSAGCFAILFHPIFGIYKEFCKIKVVVNHERSSRVRDTPPV